MDIFRPDPSGGQPIPVRGCPAHACTVGVSQVKTYLRCPRAWHNESVSRFPTKDKPHFRIGTAVHALNEAYILGKDPVFDPDTSEEIRAKARRIHARGVHLLPPPRSPSVGGVEHTVYHWIPLRGTFTGYLALYRGTVDLWEWHPTGDGQGILLTDHKTAGSTKFLDTPEKLAADVQTLCYSWALNAEAAKSGQGPYPVRMRKNYFPTAEPPKFQPFPVEADADPVVVAGMRAWISQVATLMAADAFKAEADVAQNPEACSDYGGCDWQSRCHPPESIFDRVFQIDESRKGKTTVTAQQRQEFVTAATGGQTAAPSPFDSCGEAQIRLIYTMQIDQNAPAALTRAEMLPKVRHHFTNASPDSINQWIAYARKTAPEVNPPEQAHAGPASAGPPEAKTPKAPPAETAGVEGGRRASDVAGSPEETAIRKVFRDTGPRPLRVWIVADKLPALTETFGEMREAITKGDKPAGNLMVNAVAREALARGMNAAAAAEWLASGTPSAPPVQVRAADLPTPVAEAARAAGVIPRGDVVDPAVAALIQQIPLRDQWAILRHLGKSDAEIRVPGTDSRTWAATRLGEAFGNGVDSLRGWAAWAAAQPRGWVSTEIEGGPGKDPRTFLENIGKAEFATLADWAATSPRFRAYFADPAAIHGPLQATAHELCVELQERALTTWEQFRAWVHYVIAVDPAVWTPAPVAAPPAPPAPVKAPPVPLPPAPVAAPPVPGGPGFDAVAPPAGKVCKGRDLQIAGLLRQIADLIEAGVEV